MPASPSETALPDDLLVQATAVAQFADVAFTDLRADPVGVMRGIHERFGLDWSAALESAVEAIDRESRSGAAKPSHRYSLDDYGLTEAEVRSAFDRGDESSPGS